MTREEEWKRMKGWKTEKTRRRKKKRKRKDCQNRSEKRQERKIDEKEGLPKCEMWEEECAVRHIKNQEGTPEKRGQEG